MVKVERSFPAPASLAVEAQKVKGSYSMPDVVRKIFIINVIYVN